MMVEGEQHHTINVKIGGQQYSILGQPTENSNVEAIAQFVDDKLKEVGEKTDTASSQRLAILTALNIAKEYFDFARRQREERKDLQNRLELLLKVIDGQTVTKEKGKTK